MSIGDSNILLAALDRRLQVDRIAMIDALAPAARSSDGPRQPPSMPMPMPMPMPGPNPVPAPAAPNAPLQALVDRLPLGRVVSARVVDVPRADHVVADVDDLRIEMAWPRESTPRPGDDIALRVLAHRPALLFERVALDAGVDAPTIDATDGDAIRPRWSSDAMRLQARPDGASGHGASPTRFDVPILETVIAPPTPGAAVNLDALDGPATTRGAATADGGDRATRHRSNDATAAGVAAAVLDTGSARSPLAGAAVDPVVPIAVDGSVLARAAPTVDGIDPATSHRSSDATTAPPTAFVPLVLQGPAWSGQPMELVVRHERRDEGLDDPVLDQWCGEVLIDLPHLGRVAGHLAFSMQGLRLRLEGDDERSVSAMIAGAAELAEALTRADLRVAAVSVGRPAADGVRNDA